MSLITPQKFLDTLSNDYPETPQDFPPPLISKFSPWQDKSQHHFHRHKSFHNQLLNQKHSISRKHNTSLRTNYNPNQTKFRQTRIDRDKEREFRITSINKINYPTIDVAELPYDYLDKINKNQKSVFRRREFMNKRRSKKKDGLGCYQFGEIGKGGATIYYYKQEKQKERQKEKQYEETLRRQYIRNTKLADLKGHPKLKALSRNKSQQRYPNDTQIINMPLELIQPSPITRFSNGIVITNAHNSFLSRQKFKKNPEEFMYSTGNKSGEMEGERSSGNANGELKGLARLLELSNSLFADVFKEQKIA